VKELQKVHSLSVSASESI